MGNAVRLPTLGNNLYYLYNAVAVTVLPPNYIPSLYLLRLSVHLCCLIVVPGAGVASPAGDSCF